MSPFTRMFGSRIAKGCKPTNTSRRNPAKANSNILEAVSRSDRAPRSVIASLAMDHGIFLIGAAADRRDLAEGARQLAQGPHTAVRIKSEQHEQHGIEQQSGGDARRLAQYITQSGPMLEEDAHIGIAGAEGAMKGP